MEIAFHRCGAIAQLTLLRPICDDSMLPLSGAGIVLNIDLQETVLDPEWE